MLEINVLKGFTMTSWKAPQGYPHDYVLVAGYNFNLDKNIVTLPAYFPGVEQVIESLEKQEFTQLIDTESKAYYEDITQPALQTPAESEEKKEVVTEQEQEQEQADINAPHIL